MKNLINGAGQKLVYGLLGAGLVLGWNAFAQQPSLYQATAQQVRFDGMPNYRPEIWTIQVSPTQSCFLWGGPIDPDLFSCASK